MRIQLASLRMRIETGLSVKFSQSADGEKSRQLCDEIQ